MLRFFEDILFLGVGSQAKVVSATHNIDDMSYAIKRTNMSKQATSEAIIHSKLDHENIVKYLTYWTGKASFPSNADETYSDEDSDANSKKPEALFVLVELCDGTLLDSLKKRPMPLNKVVEVLKQVVNGLQYVHKRGIRHGAICPSNIFRKTNVFKIGDFGFATQPAKGKFRQIDRFPKLIFAAPEFKSQKSFSPASDVYNLGVVLIFMLVGPAVSESVVQMVTKSRRVPASLKAIRASVLRMIMSMTDEEPRKRPPLSVKLSTI